MSLSETRQQERNILSIKPGLLEIFVEDGMLEQKAADFLKLVIRKKETMPSAFKITNPNKPVASCYSYFHNNFGRFVQLQSQESDAESFLSNRYRYPEDLEDMEGVTSSELRRQMEWDKLFAATFHGILNAPQILKANEYNLFKLRFKRYIRGELTPAEFKEKSAGLCELTRKKISIKRSTLVLNLFLEYMWTKKIPETGKLPKNFKRIWTPRFKKFYKRLSPYETFMAEAYSVGITPKILGKFSMTTDPRMVESNRPLCELIKISRKKVLPKDREGVKEFEDIPKEEFLFYVQELRESKDPGKTFDEMFDMSFLLGRKPDPRYTIS